MTRRGFWVGAGLVLAVGAAAAVLYFGRRPSPHGAIIDPPMPAAGIHLTDFNGQPFDLGSQRGRVVILYFGYTNCPDECPLTMAHLKLAVDGLGADAQKVQVVMISTDPARDTAPAMRGFLAAFDRNFLGLIGPTDRLAQTWKDYGVTVESGGATHSYFIYVIDQKGNLRETFLPDSSPDDMTADLRLLLEHGLPQ